MLIDVLNDDVSDPSLHSHDIHRGRLGKLRRYLLNSGQNPEHFALLSAAVRRNRR